MQTINDFLKPYAEIEGAVRTLMTELFSDTCGMCTACCCRADICEEAVQSAFLSQLLTLQGVSPDDMDDRFGWLDLHGCSLTSGRPPVCYSYFCDQLLARLPDDETRIAANVLGKLMHHIGQNALGEWHLVEIMNQEDLEKIDVKQLQLRLEEAEAALEVIQGFCQTGRLNAVSRKILAVITIEEP